MKPQRKENNWLCLRVFMPSYSCIHTFQQDSGFLKPKKRKFQIGFGISADQNFWQLFWERTKAWVNTTVSRAGYFSQTPHHSIICNSKTAAKINLELVMYQLKDLSLATLKKTGQKKVFSVKNGPNLIQKGLDFLCNRCVTQRVSDV